MPVAMKPNAPHPISQFGPATVNRPLMRARLGARTGAKLRAQSMIVFRRVVCPMTLTCHRITFIRLY